jgi:hypothetical protein
MITLAGDPDINFWEKSATPPGYDMGDGIDQTTFHNTAYRTKYPRTLIEITDGAITVAYDPAVHDLIIAQLGVNQEITITFNDGSTTAFWGFLKSFTPQEHSDGEQPEAQCEFVVTNLDAAFTENGPATASIAGT